MTILVDQNFEGTGVDNSESWILFGGAGGVTDPDYATSPLRGLQSLRMKDDANEGTYAITALGADLTQIWGFFMLSVIDRPSAVVEVMQSYNLQGTLESPSNIEPHDMIWLSPSGVLSHQTEEGTNTSGSTVLALNTTHYVWFYFDRRVNNRTSGWIKLSTTPELPAGNEVQWSNVVIAETYMPTNAAGFTMFHGASYEYKVDRYVVADAAIGDMTETEPEPDPEPQTPVSSHNFSGSPISRFLRRTV